MAYDLEEQESLDQLKAWWEKWGTLTLSVITVGCLGFAAYNGWNWYERHQGAKATAAYIQMQNAYVQGDDKNVKSAADALMAGYSDHVFASLAAFTMASKAETAGDLAAARQHLNWVLDKGKHAEYDTLARIRLAGVELDAKNPQRALEVLQPAKPERAQTAAYQDRLGDVYFAMNRLEDARAAWEKAVAAERGDQILTPLINLKLTALPEKK